MSRKALPRSQRICLPACVFVAAMALPSAACSSCWLLELDRLQLCECQLLHQQSTNSERPAHSLAGLQVVLLRQIKVSSTRCQQNSWTPHSARIRRNRSKKLNRQLAGITH